MEGGGGEGGGGGFQEALHFLLTWQSRSHLAK